MASKISIIIPLGPEEDQAPQLLDDLWNVGFEGEIIMVACRDFHVTDDLCDRVKILTSAQGRAFQQNAGAKAATGEHLWFLHADSRVSEKTITSLRQSIETAPEALHYFHLKFKGDGPSIMRLNEWGAWFRCQILKVPFGDQGFCLKKSHFDKIGGFDEAAPYGEDHLLVWALRRGGLKLQCTGEVLETSARKYQARGWIFLTMLYQYRWIKQAAPEVVKYILGK